MTDSPAQPGTDAGHGPAFGDFTACCDECKPDDHCWTHHQAAEPGTDAALREADVASLASALYETDPPESWMRTATDEYRKRARAMLDILARESALTPPPAEPTLDANAAYREGRRQVWRELIAYAEDGIEASSEPVARLTPEGADRG